MKTLFRIFELVGLTFLMLSLTECNPNNDRVADRDDNDQVEVELEDRDDIENDLRELGRDIDRELERINKRLEKATDTERERLEDANRRLSDDKIKVNETLEDIEN